MDVVEFLRMIGEGKEEVQMPKEVFDWAVAEIVEKGKKKNKWVDGMTMYMEYEVKGVDVILVVNLHYLDLESHAVLLEWNEPLIQEVIVDGRTYKV